MRKQFYQFLSDDELLRISHAIKQKEKITSGEIVISVKVKTPLFGSKNVQQLAVKEFNRLGINATRDNTGILIFILLEARQFYVLADSSIHSKVTENTWDEITSILETHFRSGNFCDGLVAAVNRTGDILSQHFPIKPDDTNEIPNRVIIRP